MNPIHLLLIGTFILSNIRIVNSIICFQCTDCPEPFTEDYPLVTKTNNTNFLAECSKTIMNMADGRRLISKGSVFFCPARTTSPDIQILCCNQDYCNSTAHLYSSMLLFYLSFFLIYLFMN